jgi:hypothetical protein
LGRNFVRSQGRKTEFGGPNEAFSDEGFGQKTKQECGFILETFLRWKSTRVIFEPEGADPHATLTNLLNPNEDVFEILSMIKGKNTSLRVIEATDKCIRFGVL